MQIQNNILLAPYTTFKIGGPAKFFCVVKDQFEALEACEFAQENNLQTFVLAGGSNILVSDKGFDGLVIKVESRGIEVLEDGDHLPGQVILRVASGESWDEVVSFSVKNNWWGLENLSHIPGSTGAIAVQNVGAYGQEAKNVIESVTVFNRETHEIQNLSNAECGFEYRKSIFNSTARGKYIIFYINFKLSKVPTPILTYRDLQNRFSDRNPSQAEIRDAVIEIRDKKFPFPVEAKKGNAGSFFKNPILSESEYNDLKDVITRNISEDAAIILDQKKFTENSNIKVPAAYLLEICGVKGLKTGGAAINPNQPLVIINETGSATSSDVLNLAEEVRKRVLNTTGIKLKFEPELIGFK